MAARSSWWIGSSIDQWLTYLFSCACVCVCVCVCNKQGHAMILEYVLAKLVLPEVRVVERRGWDRSIYVTATIEHPAHPPLYTPTYGEKKRTQDRPAFFATLAGSIFGAQSNVGAILRFRQRDGKVRGWVVDGRIPAKVRRRACTAPGPWYWSEGFANATTTEDDADRPQQTSTNPSINPDRSNNISTNP